MTKNRRRRSRLGGVLLAATTVVGITLGLTAPSISPVAPATADTAAVGEDQPSGHHDGHPRLHGPDGPDGPDDPGGHR